MQRAARVAAAFSFLAALAFSPTLLAQPTFVENGASIGLGDYDTLTNGFGTGAAAADFDNDGDVDIFVPTAADTPHLLFRNLGNGQFEDVASDFGLTSTEGARVALWLDIDGDQKLDLLVGADCYNVTCEVSTYTRLFRQTEEGAFVDVTVAAGLNDPGFTDAEHRGGMAAGDVNGDGHVDFVQSIWEGTFRLFLNQGDGTFSDISVAAGIDAPIVAYHQPIIADLNGDGLQDIYAAVDFDENFFWLNQGVSDGLPTFVEVGASTGTDNAMNDMGVALGDYDEDGDPDLYITNIFREEENKHNVLLVNDGAAASFSEVSQATGVDDGGWGWGTTFLDFDNNGTLDLAETNGWRFSQWDQPPRLYVHQAGAPITFVDVAASAGLTGVDWGSALMAFDADADGDVDMVSSTQDDSTGTRGDGALVLYRNDLDRSLGDQKYLLIRPRMNGANHRALGAKVTVEAGDKTMHRWITAGISYLGQEPAEAFFGLGSTVLAERVTVVWPMSPAGLGVKTVAVNIAADQVVTLTSDVVFADGFESGDTSAW